MLIMTYGDPPPVIYCVFLKHDLIPIYGFAKHALLAALKSLLRAEYVKEKNLDAQ